MSSSDWVDVTVPRQGEAWIDEETHRTQVFTNAATPGEYPEGREDESEAWKADFDYAARKGNTSKAAAIYADHRTEARETQEFEDLREEKAQLERQLRIQAKQEGES